MRNAAGPPIALWAAVVAVVALVAFVAAACGGSAGDGGPVDIRDRAELEVYDDEHTAPGQIHLPVGASAEYTVLPPYGEEHSPIPLTCGIYSAMPTFEMVVHGMEHGAVVLWYAPSRLSSDDLAALTEISSERLNSGRYAIQAPYDGLETPLMLVAWGARLPLERIEPQAIDQFFDEFHDNAPEPLAAGGCTTAN